MRRAFFFIVAIVVATTSFASIPRAAMLDRASEDASPLVASLSETRIRASEVLAPFERPAESELTRALRQAYEHPSTTNASGLRCFLSVDPIYSSDLRFPQSWNKYSYVMNNPLKFVDPTGMYVTACMSGDEACAREAAAFEAARQAQLKSTDESLRKAAAAYGNPGVENGVSISFVSARAMGTSNADVTAQLIIGEQATGKFDVQVRMGMSTEDLKNAVSTKESTFETR